MARTLKFREDDVLLDQGDEDTAAYLIHTGWLQVCRVQGRSNHCIATLGPGEIVGELGLAGLVSQRTATVRALTDGEVEIIDRGTLIRLVNGPGNRLVPLLSALFSRLQSMLLDDPLLDDTVVAHAKIEGLNPEAARALCNRPRLVSHLPWTFGAYTGPRSVTDLFQPRQRVDVKLADESQVIREKHVQLEESDDEGLQLRLIQHGDFCEVDDHRIGYGSAPCILPLSLGEHTLAFGHQSNPIRFRISIPG